MVSALTLIRSSIGARMLAPKVTAEEMRGVPHHPLDITDVRDEASMAEFQERSRELERFVLVAAKLILVGGSGLSVRAALIGWSSPARMRGCVSA